MKSRSLAWAGWCLAVWLAGALGAAEIPAEHRLPALPGLAAPKPLEIAVPPFLKTNAVAETPPLGPQQVVVVAVKDDADSIAVAKYYMEKRGVPGEQLLLVDLPGNDGDAIPRGKFNERVVKPLRELLSSTAWGKQVRCIVTAYRMPIYVIGEKITLDPGSTEPETILGNLAAMEQHNNTTAAAVDSELALLFADQSDRDRCGWTMNPAYQAYDVADLRTLGVYITGRIDGPTVAIAQGLVDKALAAEAAGLTGKAYFDARKKAFNAAPLGYDQGERWMRFSALQARNAGMETTLDEKDTLFEADACPDCALYYGWYALTEFKDAFGGKPATGALMIHLASGEGQIRWQGKKTAESEINGGPWCLGFLRIGATGTCGPVQEPFLKSFPSDDYFAALFRGRPAGEAYQLSLSYASWMLHYIGDPLYRPFLKNPKTDFVYLRGQLKDGEAGSKALVFYTGNNNTIELAVGRPWGKFTAPFQVRVVEKSEEVDLKLDAATFTPEAEGAGLRIGEIKLVVAENTEFPEEKGRRSNFKFKFLEADIGLTDASGAEKILPVTIIARPNPRAKPKPPAELPKAPPPEETK